jgi:cytosine/adenosine deaminase-related metal-dependent hydrolase
VKEQTGYLNIQFFVKNELASSKLCLAHCIWLSDFEMEYLKEFNINVMHCPAANLKLGSGFARIPEMLQEGINVSLGSDGAPCNNNLDMFMEMRLAALIHKPNFGVGAIHARQIFDMATIAGAKTLGMADQIGSIQPDKLADLVILNLNKVHLTPADNVISQIVYSAQSKDVLHVMVGGEWVVQNKIPLAYPDEEKIVFTAQKECARLIKRMN